MLSYTAGRRSEHGTDGLSEGGVTREGRSLPPACPAGAATARPGDDVAAMFEMVSFIGWLLNLYSWVIIAAALISWVSPDPRNPIVAFLRMATEPVLAPVRRLLPPWKTGGLDLSPMIVLIAIQFVDRVIIPMLFRSLMY